MTKFLYYEGCLRYTNRSDNKKMKKKVNSYGDTKNIPKNIARNLAELHWELIEELHNVYGGYATCWFENAKKMLD